MNSYPPSSSLAAKIASFSPMNACVVAVEKTLATTMGVNRLSEKSRSRISSTKKTPAMGALKIEAMPAAAPQPTKVFMRSRSTPVFCPIHEPSVEPICTIGPSVPADPPVPTVVIEAKTFTMPMRAGITPPFWISAFMTCGTPWPFASLAKKYTSRLVTVAPATGRATSTHRPWLRIESCA